MTGNRDFAAPYAGRAVFGRNVQAAHIRGRNGGMKLAGTGDGSENVSSKIQKVWKQ